VSDKKQTEAYILELAPFLDLLVAKQQKTKTLTKRHWTLAGALMWCHLGIQVGVYL
jgi:hypothetical protein